MSGSGDDPSKRHPQDGQRIAMTQEHEVRYWTGKFGVSREELQAAVDRVGHMAADVERHLKGKS